MSIIDWAFVLLVFWGLSRAWIRYKSVGATVITVLCLLILGSYALALGESWFRSQETVMFPLNLWYEDIYSRVDWKPVGFLILIASVVGFFARWPLGKAFKVYSEKPNLPGTMGPAAPAYVCVLISLYCAATAGSYIKMARDQEPGHYTVAFITTATSKVLGAVSEMASEAGIPDETTSTP